MCLKTLKTKKPLKATIVQPSGDLVVVPSVWQSSLEGLSLLGGGPLPPTTSYTSGTLSQRENRCSAEHKRASGSNETVPYGLGFNLNLDRSWRIWRLTPPPPCKIRPQPSRAARISLSRYLLGACSVKHGRNQLTRCVIRQTLQVCRLKMFENLKVGQWRALEMKGIGVWGHQEAAQKLLARRLQRRPSRIGR